MSKAVLIITIVVVLIVLIGAGFFLKTRIDKLTAEPTPSPTSVATTPITTEPTPSPTPSFDRSKYTLRILNGTKTAGLAATVSAKLKDLGYQIGKTGNATSSAIEQTAVRTKNGNDDLIAQLIKDLASDYQAASASALKASDDVDAEIIIGTK